MHVKRCPFCGGKAKFVERIEVLPVIDENGAYTDADTIYWQKTGCPNCDIWFSSYDDEDAPEYVTITKWNKRARTRNGCIGRRN